MQVIIKGGSTDRAEFLIKEEADAKLLASAILSLYLESKADNHKGVNITAYARECEAEVDPCLKDEQESKE